MAKLYTRFSLLPLIIAFPSHVKDPVFIFPATVKAFGPVRLTPEELAVKEEIMNVAYPAGKVSTLITLDPISGKLKKVEKIQGGILGASLGNGTHVSEEVCLLSKMPYKTKEQPK